MDFKIFRVPGEDEDLSDCLLGDVNDGIVLEYEALFCGAGTATIDIPITSPYVAVITPGVLIYSKDEDMCWIVKNVKQSGTTITASCYDLNGMLYDRITMPAESPVAGTEGKDAVAGTTEYCVKHYVHYNMISSPFTERNYPRFEVAEDMGRGLISDSYLASYACVDDVVRELCEGAELGYRIAFDITTSSFKPVFVFDVIERTDRTVGQDENNRVIFSVGMRNITGIEREVGVTAQKNALWCETGGIDGFVNEKDDVVPTSWDRREEYISLSVVDKYSVDEIALAARKEITDKFAETDSLTIEAGNPLDYRNLYNLGDVVTVYDKSRSVQLDSVISAVKVKRTATEHTVSITLGNSKPKLLDGYAKKSSMLGRNQRDFPAALPSDIARKLQTADSALVVTTVADGMEIRNPAGQYIGRLSLSDQKFDLSSGSSTISMDGNNNYFQLYGGSLKVILESLGLSVTSGNMTFEALSGLGGRYRITDSGITFEWANGTKLELYSDPSSGGISISWVSGAKMRFSADPNGGGELSCSWRGGGSLEYSEATGTLKVNGKRVLTEE